ncbi:MAG: hypothetical protein ISQ86_10940 [Alphaproteobacteria bacterium]|nr:hypothetical protein [Alphaproteobacteria bacterium]
MIGEPVLKLKSIGLAVVLTGVLLPAVAADMSAEDREARCANNQARLAPLERQYASYASDEEISRLRTAHAALNRYFSNRDKIKADVEWARLRHLGRTPCTDNPNWCLINLASQIEERLEAALHAIPERDAAGREIASIRGRMVELQCIAPPPPDGTEASTGIHVKLATLGANCRAPQGNVTSQVGGLCNGRNECALTGAEVNHPDPAYGCMKDLSVEWTCSDDGPTKSNSVGASAYETTKLHLTCP